MSRLERRFRIPAIGWAAGGLGVVVALMLALPSNKQRQVTLAQERLALTFACPPSIAELVKNRQFIESQVPKNTSTLVGAPTEPIERSYESSVRRIAIWNPSSARPLDTYDIDFPSLSNVGNSYSSETDALFPGRTVVIAPEDNHFDQELLGLALILWMPKREMGSQLDNWRTHFRDKATRPGAIAHIKRALAKETPERLAEAKEILRRNREACKSFPHGSTLYVDSKGKVYMARFGLKYDFESTWETASGDSRR